MLKDGRRYLEGLRDGRVVYIGGERVDDVTEHPAFRNAARSYARIYDARFEDPLGNALSYEENGERYATYFLRPHSQDDLRRRSRCSEVIADLTFGLMGRSPDFVAGYITGAAMQPEVFDVGNRKFSSNVTALYDYCRRNDLFLSHAVAPPQGTRDQKIMQRDTARVPSLSVVNEDQRGVTVSGMKMLATSAAFSDLIWIGNLLPLAQGHEAESITCLIPPGAPGVSLWSRKPFERYAVSEFDNYLSYHFDEGDCVVICDNVHVPWEFVLTHNEIAHSRQIYLQTPAHTLSNHQAAVRFSAKMKLLLGLARRITQAMGIDGVPAVADDLGHLAGQYGIINGLIAGQIEHFERLSNGYVNFNRHYMYSAIYFATQNYDQICAKVRELSGGSVLQMPADVSVLHDPTTRAVFEEFWDSPNRSALEKFQLFKLGWDLLGSDFGGRHAQYERFYMGPAFIVRSHVSRETAWTKIESYVDDLLSSYGAGEILNRGTPTQTAQGNRQSVS